MTVGPLGMEVREGGDKGIPVVVSFPTRPNPKPSTT